MTDEELIRRFAQRRDEEAFRELYARHTPAVYGLILRITSGRTEDSADIVQDAWLRAAVGIGRFRGESAFRTWLTGIALNCYREVARVQSRRGPTGATDHAPGPAESGDGRIEVVDVLDGMAEDHRAVLVLHDVEGYTHEEIANALGIEVGTSKSRLSRARRLFRERWSAVPSSAGAKP